MELIFIDEIVFGDNPTLDSLRRLAFERSGDLTKIDCSNVFNVGQLTQVLDQMQVEYLVLGTAVMFVQSFDPRHNEGLLYLSNGKLQQTTAEDYCAFYDKFVTPVAEREPVDFAQKLSTYNPQNI